MATKTNIEDVIEQYCAAILSAADRDDLFKVGKSIAQLGLAEDALEELRFLYAEKRKELQTTIKADMLNGRVVVLSRPRYIDTRIGPNFMLRGTFEDDGKDFECWAPGSANGPVHRFFERRPPTAYPVRVIMTHGPHPSDAKKTMWTIEALPAAQSEYSSVPF